jgi:intraflagellar transport protein 172
MLVMLKGSQGERVIRDFKDWLNLYHLLALKEVCSRKESLKPLAAKQAIALLRYVHILRADQAFYEAGRLAKEAKMNKMAFLCWNRFLDISDSIEEGEAVPDSEFGDTDVPLDMYLPTRPLSENVRDQARDFVLQYSLSQTFEKKLGMRICDACGKETYEAGLTCHYCNSKTNMCVVTGNDF